MARNSSGLRVKGMTIEIGADVSGLSKALSQTSRNLSDAKRSISDLNKALKFDPDNVDLLNDRTAAYGRAVDAAREKVQTLRQALSTGLQNGTFDESSREAQTLRQEIDLAQSSLNSLSNTYQQMQENGGHTAQELASAQEDVTDAIEDTSDASDDAAGHIASMFDVQKVEDFGNTLTEKVTKPIADFAKQGISEAIDVESASAKVSTLGQLTDEQLANVEEQVRRISDETGVAQADLMENVYSALSGSIDPDKVVDFVETATKGAIAGFTESDAASDIMNTIVNNYGDAAGEYSEIMDKLMVTQNKGRTTVADLAQYLGDAIPTFSAAGISFDEVSGAMASLTKNGLATNKAVNSLKMLVSGIIKPTTEAAQAAETLGIDFDAASLSEKGLYGFMSDMRAQLEQTAPEFVKMSDAAAQYQSTIAANSQTIEDNKAQIDALTASNKQLKEQMDNYTDENGKHTTSSDGYKELKKQYDANKDSIKELTAANKELNTQNTATNKELAAAQSQMETLGNASDSTVSAYATLFGSVEALNGALVLSSDQGLADFKSATDAMGDSAGTMSDAFDKMDETTGQQLAKLKTELQNIAGDLGEELLPVLKDLADVAKELLDNFNGLSDDTKKVIMAGAGIAAAFGPLLSGGAKIAQFASAVKNLRGASGTVSAIGNASQAASAASTAASAGSVEQSVGNVTEIASASTKLKNVGVKFLDMSSYVAVAAEIGLVVKEYAKIAYEISQYDFGDNYKENMQKTLTLAGEMAAFTAGLSAVMTAVTKSGNGLSALAGEGLAAVFGAELAGAAEIIKIYAGTVQEISDLQIGDDYQGKIDRVTAMMGTAGAFTGGVTALMTALNMGTGGAASLAALLAEGVVAGAEAELAAAAGIIGKYAETVQKINDLTIDQASLSSHMQAIQDTMATMTATLAGNGVAGFFALPAIAAGGLENAAAYQEIKQLISIMNELTTVELPDSGKLQSFQAAMVQMRDIVSGSSDSSLLGIFSSIGGAISSGFDSSQTQNIHDEFMLMLDMIKGLNSMTGTADTSLAAGWEQELSLVDTETQEHMAAIVETVKTGIASIEQAFRGASLAFTEDIKLPHFKMDGGWDAQLGTVPSVSVDWYKEGGIFDRPSVIGVGEAGTEAVAPVEKLESMIVKAVDANNSQILSVMGQMLNVLQSYLPGMSNTQIVMDSGALVGSLASGMDEALGNRAARRNRQK